MTPLRTIALAFGVILVGLPFAQAEELGFSLDPDAQTEIVQRIQSSGTTIEGVVYGLSSGDIARALAEASRRGVEVRLVMDQTLSSDRESIRGLLESLNVTVRTIPQLGRQKQAHHRFLIFDQNSVFTGGYSWQENTAAFNPEKLLFTGDRRAVAYYQQDFQKLWEEESSAGPRQLWLRLSFNDRD